jgi:hypothetical protein
MERKQVVLAGAAKQFDAFLARAAEEFGSNAHSREETFRRIDAWIDRRRKSKDQAEG